VARHPPHSPSKTGVNALMSGRDRTTDAASSSALLENAPAGEPSSTSRKS
jgi:hypothetical protein